MPALPLSPTRKRTMLANFCSAQLQCRPGGTGEAVPRGEAACVVCARKDWLESRFKCFLWKELPGGGAAEPAAQGGEGEQGAASDSEDEQLEQKRSLLRDADGAYYFGDPTLINGSWASSTTTGDGRRSRRRSSTHPRCNTRRARTIVGCCTHAGYRRSLARARCRQQRLHRRGPRAELQSLPYRLSSLAWSCHAAPALGSRMSHFGYAGSAGTRSARSSQACRAPPSRTAVSYTHLTLPTICSV